MCQCGVCGGVVLLPVQRRRVAAGQMFRPAGFPVSVTGFRGMSVLEAAAIDAQVVTWRVSDDSADQEQIGSLIGLMERCLDPQSPLALHWDQPPLSESYHGNPICSPQCLQNRWSALASDALAGAPLGRYIEACGGMATLLCRWQSSAMVRRARIT